MLSGAPTVNAALVGLGQHISKALDMEAICVSFINSASEHRGDVSPLAGLELHTNTHELAEAPLDSGGSQHKTHGKARGGGPSAVASYAQNNALVNMAAAHKAARFVSVTVESATSVLYTETSSLYLLST